MPGPVSDSYDPEFGTGADAEEVRDAHRQIVERINKLLGPKLHNIVEVAQGKPGPMHSLELSERQLRIIRFALNRSMESI